MLPYLLGACLGSAAGLSGSTPPNALPMQARATFNKLAKYGLHPSPASRAALAEAQCAAGQWSDAVQDYEALVHSG